MLQQTWVRLTDFVTLCETASFGYFLACPYATAAQET